MNIISLGAGCYAVNKTRTIAWFSCGIPSAVNAWLSVQKYDAEVIYCDTSSEEHPDNMRFLLDVEQWIGKKIQFIRSTKYKSPTEVFEARKYMSGISGAPCTVELKKIPRFSYQHIDDVHSWGYHIGEETRIELFELNNPELKNVYPLIEAGYTKEDCKSIVHNAGIKEPMMYKLGFDHNNCIGCVKASSPKYWNKIRQHFPIMFDLRSEQSRRIGAKLVRSGGMRIFLDEIDPDSQEDLFEDISCGPQCAVLPHESTVPDDKNKKQE
jgi:hypothetical protein